MAEVDVFKLKPLLDRVLARDGQAFNTLLAQLRPYLHARVRKQLGTGAEGPIDNSVIVQSVLRRVAVKFEDLEDPTVPVLLGWIGKIVRNRVIDALRQAERRREQPLGSAVLELTDPKPATADLEAAERSAAVATALTRLTERERRVVESRWFDRQPDEATAQDLGITVNHVHQLRFRALSKLGELLKHLEEARE